MEGSIDGSPPAKPFFSSSGGRSGGGGVLQFEAKDAHRAFLEIGELDASGLDFRASAVVALGDLRPGTFPRCLHLDLLAPDATVDAVLCRFLLVDFDEELNFDDHQGSGSPQAAKRRLWRYPSKRTFSSSFL